MLNLTPYRALFADRELRRIILTSVIPRLPVGMNTLGLTLLVQAQTGSFGAAGIVSAFYLAALGVQAPIVGRLIDLHSPKRVMLPLGLLHAILLLLLVFTVIQGLAKPYVLAATVLAGLSFPPVGTIIRSMWRKSSAPDSVKQTAFALESVIMECIFVVGPMLVALTIVVASPVWAVVGSSLLTAIGIWFFCRSGALTRWGEVERGAVRHWLGPLKVDGVRRALLLSLLVAFGIGLHEIALPAFATQIGQPLSIGWLYASLSVPSAIAGLIYGSRSFSMALNRQITIGCIWLGCGALLMAAATLFSSAWPMAIACILCGLAFGPMLTALSLQLGKLSPSEYSTEAFTWSMTLFMIGIGFGFSVGGALIEWRTAAATLIASAIVMLLTALYSQTIPALHIEK